MKLYHFMLISILIALSSCSHTSSTIGPITIVQLKSLDFMSIRPRLISLLGNDSSGREALSMITTYEDFLLSQYPQDTSYERVPEENPLNDWRRWDVGIIEEEQRGKQKPNIKQTATTNLFLQILHQNLLKWTNELTNYHTEYVYTNDIRNAKKGAATGYNALISGPAVNDIPKITDKMQLLIDSLYAHR